MDENKKNKNEAVEWIKSIAAAVVIALIIKIFVFNTTYVLGNSMYPTLHERDRLFALKIPLYFDGPKRGDVIVLEAPDNPAKDYIKRVIGISGDKIEIIDGRVYVNDMIIEENYLVGEPFTHTYNESVWIVQEGDVFVLGDNREEGASKDSRYFGAISLDSVKGITEFRYYPIDNRFGRID